MPDPKSTYRWSPIGAHSPEAAAAAELALSGVDEALALRLAPIAAAVDAHDAGEPINPNWPGITIVDDVDAPDPHPIPAGAFVLELVRLRQTVYLVYSVEYVGNGEFVEFLGELFEDDAIKKMNHTLDTVEYTEIVFAVEK